MYLVKQDNGSYIPSHNSDYAESQKVKVGQEVRATRARNVGHHRKTFALIKLGFESQDKFDDIAIYRMVLTMKAGFVTFVKGTDGKEHPLPNSISFEAMSQSQFEDYYAAILTVISKETKLSGGEIESELASFY